MNAHGVLRCLKFSAVVVAVTLLAACGGSSSGDQQTNTVPPPINLVLTEGFPQPAAARAITTNGRPLIVANNQVIIVLDEDIAPDKYLALQDKLSALGVRQIGTRIDMRMLVATTPGANGEEAVIAGIKTLPGVANVNYNFAVETSRANPPPTGQENTPIWQKILGQVRAQAIAPEGRWWLNQIDLTAAHAVEDDLRRTTGPTIAVVDTGLPADQTVLAASRVRRVDALGTALTGDSTVDAIDHGLTVSAFAAGASADAGGVSRFSSLLSVDVYRDECRGFFSLLGCPLNLGRTFVTELAEGVRTAVLSNARVINVSWGDNSKCNDTQATRIASLRDFRTIQSAVVNLARRNDKLVVFAASNNCEKADDQLLSTSTDPSADSWLSHALIVGASTESRFDALFSRMGKVVNLMAPGESVSYGKAPTDGTSFSAPIVAGAAAVVQTISPSLSAPETRFLLMNGAESTIRFASASTAAYRGYVGSDARTPTGLLNVGNSARAAKLTIDAPLRTLEAVSIAKGATKTVSFDVTVPATGVNALDVVFVIDVSGSYSDDIAQLRLQARGIIDSLKARGIDVQFGVSAFSDFPRAPYGESGDFASKRLTRITGNTSDILNGINALTIFSGSDEPESQLEALYQVATGSGRDLNGDGIFQTASGDVEPQPMGFRPGAARVIVFATDAPFHNSDVTSAYPGAGFNQTVAALKAQSIRIIALQSGNTSTAQRDIDRLITATGGSAYQLSSNSQEIAQAIAAGIDAAFAEVDVSLEKIAGAEWITNVAQDKVRARGGEVVRFTLTLQGQRSSTVDALSYDLYAWVRANNTALLQRVKLPVKVAP